MSINTTKVIHYALRFARGLRSKLENSTFTHIHCTRRSISNLKYIHFTLDWLVDQPARCTNWPKSSTIGGLMNDGYAMQKQTDHPIRMDCGSGGGESRKTVFCHTLTIQLIETIHFLFSLVIKTTLHVQSWMFTINTSQYMCMHYLSIKISMQKIRVILNS